MKISSGLDILILLLYAKGANGEKEKIRGITKLEKLVYLLKEEGGFGNYISCNYNFEPYNFGPYSSEVYDNIEALKDLHIVDVENVDLDTYIENTDAEEINSEIDTYDDSQKVDIYELTEDGEKIGEKLYEDLTEKEKNALEKIKTVYNSMSLQQLLRTVYAKYPNSATKSIIREEILGKIER